MIGLIGKKLGMTQVLKEDEGRVPLSVIEAGPCYVVGMRTSAKEGYEAVQLGFGKSKRTTKPLQGVFKRARVEPLAHVFEFRIAESQSDSLTMTNPAQEKGEGKTDSAIGYELGQKVGVEIFKEGDHVDVTGWSKGKGFQGVVKRHGYSGGPKTHGAMTGRRPGSIGASTTPGRVIKGKGLPGRMGGKRITVKNLRILKVNPERNLILVRGAIPGAIRGIVLIKKSRNH
jgi:large subunit ribosomal protein L3